MNTLENKLKELNFPEPTMYGESNNGEHAWWYFGPDFEERISIENRFGSDPTYLYIAGKRKQLITADDYIKLKTFMEFLDI